MKKLSLKRALFEQQVIDELHEMEDDDDGVKEAVDAQIKVLVDEVLHAWVEMKDEPDWIQQCERAAQEFERNFPADTIYQTIGEHETKLLAGHFKRH